MKHNSMLASLAALVLVLALLAGCAAPAPQQTAAPIGTQEPSTTPAATEKPAQRAALKITALKGPTGMGFVQLMKEDEEGKTAVDYDITLSSAPDEISGKIITGEADIAAAPINLAAALYNKTQGDVAIIAVNTFGVLYILENGDQVKNVADLSGKTLYATGQGATPEFILNYLLEKNGIAGKVDIKYMADHTELATLLAAGEGGVSLAMLPEPNATASLLKNSALRVALDLTEEWNKVSGGTQLVQGCLIARREVIQNNPDAVKAFLQEYAASTSFVNEKPEEAAALIEQYGIMASAAAAKAAIPNCNIVCVTGPDMQADALAMLQVLYNADPKSVGGKLPGEDFYYLP